jgi:dTDP-4-dehydrorhamnose reductase
MRRILVFGREGQVGIELMGRADSFGFDAEGPTRRQGDITDAGAVEAAFARGHADAAVNVAAYTAVDRAESEIEAAFATNGQGAAIVAAAARRHEVPLIHVSTDFVFGDRPDRHPWVEEDPIAPLSVYGASKAAGELAVRAAQPRHAILRTAGIFSQHRRNFVKAILAAAQEGRPLDVVDDQVTCPTPAGDVADAILGVARAIAEGGSAWGTFHYCATPAVTWHGFADAILGVYASLGGARPTLTPVGSAGFGATARRPAYSVLDCGRIAREWSVAQRPWRTALPAIVTAIVQSSGGPRRAAGQGDSR